MLKFIRTIWEREFESIRGKHLDPGSFLMIRGDILHFWILLLSTAFSVIYSIIDIILGTKGEAFYVALPGMVSLFSYFLLFKKGHKALSKILLVLVTVGVISVLCVMEGPQTGVMVFFIPILVATQIMFPGGQRIYAWGLTMIALVALIGLLYTGSSLNAKHVMPEIELRTEWILNFTGGIVATVFQVWFLLSVSTSMQRELLQTTDSLKSANQELTVLLKENAEQNWQIRKQVVLLNKARLEALKLSYIATNTRNSVVITDREGRLEWVNKAFEELSGWELKEVMGKKQDEFLLGAGSDQGTAELISKHISAGAFLETTILNYTKSGKPYYNRIELTPLFGEHGEVVNFFSIQRDITAEMTAQEKIMQERTKKQKLIAQIAIQAHEIQQNRIAIELHENVNQILAAAKMQLDMYMESAGDPDPKLKEIYDHIGKALNVISTLSHDLAVPFETGFDLADVVGDMVSDLESRSGLMVDLLTEIDEEVVLSEDIRLAGYRIVQEQMNNVEVHAHAKNLFIELAARKDGLYISVDDDGVGFDVQKQPKGIGLTKIESRVRFHSGEMHIESEPGQGCKLHVFLPVAS